MKEGAMTAPAISGTGGPTIPQGFFGRLFDTSFRSFITPSIISLVFILLVILAGIFTLIVVAAAFNESSGAGLVTLILSPVVFLLYVILARMYLELVVVLFRVEANTRDMADGTRR
jgi:hypothetical protein